MACSACGKDGHNKTKCPNKTLRQRYNESYFSRYGAEYNYDIERNCRYEGCDSICRCGRIINPSIESIHELTIEEIKKYLLYGYKNLDFLTYAFQKHLFFLGYYDIDNWEVDICGGYYGQEVNYVSCDSNVLDDIFGSFNKFLEQSFDEQIESLLTLEYGYIIDYLKDCSYKIEEHSVSNIHQSVYVKLNIDRLREYENNFPYIAGILYRDEVGVLRLVDGHHRHQALLNRKDFSLYKYIVAEKR